VNDCCEEKPVVDDCCDSETKAAKTDTFLWFSIISVLVLYALGLVLPHGDGGTLQLTTMAHGVMELVNKMWWGIAVGIIFVGLLARIPRDLVMSVLGQEKGFRSLLRATMAGVLLDLCSHGILAVGMKLYERGASVGQVMAFLLASPWNSFPLP
jgi:uncharacterized membrane protein YraQ (UPF0718 family)